MMNLQKQVAAFQVAPKYNICIGQDNANLLLGLILDRAIEAVRKEYDPDIEYSGHFDRAIAVINKLKEEK